MILILSSRKYLVWPHSGNVTMAMKTDRCLKQTGAGKYPSCTDPYKMGMEWKSHYQLHMMGMGWRSAYCYIWEASLLLHYTVHALCGALIVNALEMVWKTRMASTYIQSGIWWC